MLPCALQQPKKYICNKREYVHVDIIAAGYVSESKLSHQIVFFFFTSSMERIAVVMYLTLEITYDFFFEAIFTHTGDKMYILSKEGTKVNTNC